MRTRPRDLASQYFWKALKMISSMIKFLKKIHVYQMKKYDMRHFKKQNMGLMGSFD
jgi:hypothetical protein